VNPFRDISTAETSNFAFSAGLDPGQRKGGNMVGQPIDQIGGEWFIQEILQIAMPYGMTLMHFLN
jgi:hypothetical protein